jgi:hypothetical protein
MGKEVSHTATLGICCSHSPAGAEACDLPCWRYREPWHPGSPAGLAVSPLTPAAWEPCLGVSNRRALCSLPVTKALDSRYELN